MWRRNVSVLSSLYQYGKIASLLVNEIIGQLSNAIIAYEPMK